MTERQQEIIRLVKENAPITGEQIADRLGLSRPTLRSDLALLVMLGLIAAKPKVGYFLGQAVPSPEPKAGSLHRLLVRDVQSLPVIVHDTASIQDAVVTMFIENVDSLFVTDSGGALVGIVSRKDMLKLLLGGGTGVSMPVSLAMTRMPNVVTVSPDDPVLEAARLLAKHDVNALPVVEGGEVVGRITKTTMTHILLEWAPYVP